MKFKNSLYLLVFFLFIAACTTNNNTDSNPDPNPSSQSFLCCGANPFLSQNVDNLNQSAGAINVLPVFTPNGDGFYDYFVVENLHLYGYNSITLFGLNDQVVFSTENYGSQNNLLGGVNINLESGTYKYKLVVENENTFTEFGYVCLVNSSNDLNGFSFSSQCSVTGDPILP